MRVRLDALALFVSLLPAAASAQATASFPDLDATPSGADHLVERAERRVAQDQLTRALVDYTDALRLDRRNPRAWLGLGSVRERLGQFEEAEAVYTQAARIRSIAADALYFRGVLRSRRGELAAATRDLYASTNLAPLAPRLETLANLYVKLEAWPAALAVWRKIYALDAEDAPARRQAENLIAALEVLAGDTDTVALGRDRSWVRRIMYRSRPP
jgi:tetratricopeptide (TPR) repeat protein